MSRRRRASAVRHPLQFELDVLALAELANRATTPSGITKVGMFVDRRMNSSSNASRPPSRRSRDTREVEAGDGLVDPVRVVLGQVHRDQEGPHGRPGRAEPGIDRGDPGPALVPFPVVFAGDASWLAKTGKKPQDPAATRTDHSHDRLEDTPQSHLAYLFWRRLGSELGRHSRRRSGVATAARGISG